MLSPGQTSSAPIFEPPCELALTAQSLVEGLWHGRHLSLRRGHADEFYDYRPYSPGESAHNIDWRAAARRDSLYVKRRRSEAQLTVTIVVDASASMGFRSLTQKKAPTKLAAAKEMAAGLAMIASRQGDRVGLVVAGDDAVALPPAPGRAHSARLIDALSRATPAGKEGISAGVLRASRLTPSADLLIVLSDALEPIDTLSAALLHVSRIRRAPVELMLIQTLSSDELSPTPMRAQFVDPETRFKATMTSRRDTDRIGRAMAGHVSKVRQLVTSSHGRYALHLTSHSCLQTLWRLLNSSTAR